jgi:Uncharacterized protein conserved in bacteria (DUF2188)
MHGPRYIVASVGAQWKIVHGGPLGAGLYSTKTQAVCAAIELAGRDAGAEVLVQHEDGYVQTEWVQGQDEAPEKAARPIAGQQPDDLAGKEPDEIGPQGGYGGAGDDQDHPKG